MESLNEICKKSQVISNVKLDNAFYWFYDQPPHLNSNLEVKK